MTNPLSPLIRRLRQAPPEAHRARLFWLMLPLAMIAGAHALYLPTWVGVAWGACALGRLVLLALERRRYRQRGGSDHAIPGLGRALRLLLVVLALAAFVGVFLQFGTVLGPEGGLSLLLLLTGLKLLETHDSRDHMVMTFIGYFLLMATFIHSQTPAMAGWLLLAALLLTAGLAATQSAQPRPVVRDLRLAGRLLLQALPLAAALFLLFPRLPTPMGVLQIDSAGETGLSDRMEPGSVSELMQSSEVAFRLDMLEGGDRADPRRFYWRGPVLWHYDGRTWSPRAFPGKGPPHAEARGQPIRYGVTLEPHGRRWLFIHGLVGERPRWGAELTPDFVWLAPSRLDSRVRYEVSAYPDYRLEPELDDVSRQQALALPDGIHPRARALAGGWRAGARQPEEVVNQALSYFRQERFFYTLRPPPLGPDRVDSFLFDTRRGFCEHYAGAFTVLMRAAGIPARVVTGYQGAELNPMGDYWIVRQRDAHAWAEVWLDGQGWTRVDPTAAVAPSRVEQGVAAALPAAERTLLAVDGNWLRPLRQTLDMLNNHWNQWILGYDRDRQRSFLSSLHPWLSSLEGMLWGLLAAAGLLVAILLVLLFRPGLPPPADPAARLYQRFRHRLAAAGLDIPASEPPGDLARRIRRERPDLADAIDTITDSYIACRYGHGGEPALKALRQAVATFRPRRAG